MSLAEQQVANALPGYEVGRELGRGGWGVVLAGKHRQLGREVAIKQLPAAFAADPEVLQRFVAEARLLASLDHPHIVPIYDYVEANGLCVLVMEQLPGGTAWDRFTTVGLTPASACAIALATCAGLSAAHHAHILHRDVKPENMMFAANGVLKVTDFGIAKVIGGDQTMATRAGDVVGTPAYIAPEQARGQALSPATDVYAVATMLYEFLAGRLPFPDDGDAMGLLFKHAFEQPVPLHEAAPSIPAPIAAVVMSGLATDPGGRPPTADGFALALAEACTASWGPGWLAAEGTPVMGAPKIVAATERSLALLPPATAPDAVSPAPAFGPRPSPAPPTEARPRAADAAPPTIGHQPAPESPRPDPTPADAPPVAAPPPADPTPVAPAPPSVAVRPSLALHTKGVALADVAAADLVPASDVVEAPPRAVPFVLLALLLLAATFVLAASGLGTPARTNGTLRPGQVLVAGRDVAAGGTTDLDLARPVVVGLTASAPGADHVRLSFCLLSMCPVKSTAVVGGARGGPRTSPVEVGSKRYAVAGRLTARVELLAGGQVIGRQDFAARSTQQRVLTGPGLATIALLLFLFAYAESSLRLLWRGRRVPSATTSLVIVSAAIGAVAPFLVWILGTDPPTVLALLACAAVAAAAGVVGAMAALRAGRGRRHRRLVKGEPAGRHGA